MKTVQDPKFNTAKPTEHTPGPWTIRDDAPHVKLIRCESEHVTVAVLQDEANPGEESLATLRADARLIAAAPELLGAAKEALKFATPTSPLADMLRAAIAKATGGES